MFLWGRNRVFTGAIATHICGISKERKTRGNGCSSFLLCSACVWRRTATIWLQQKILRQQSLLIMVFLWIFWKKNHWHQQWLPWYSKSNHIIYILYTWVLWKQIFRCHSFFFFVHFFSLILLTGKVWLIGQLKFPHLKVSKLTARPMVVTEWFKKATSKTLNTGNHPSPTSQKHERGQDWRIPKSSKGICCVHNPELFVSFVFHILCKPITTGTVL